MLNETFSVIFRHRASKKLLLKHIQLNFSDDLRPNVPGVTNRSAPLIWFVKLYITFSMWIASNASFVNDNWPLEINCSLSTRIPWFAKKTTMLHLQVWHTVRKSQIVSKNCEFEFSCQKLMNHPDYDTLFSYYNLNFSAKNCQNSTFVRSVLTQNHDFGVKIQIIQENLAFKNYQKTLFYTSNTQIHNFDVF